MKTAKAIKAVISDLEEIHAAELKTDHHGDGPDGCSYCRDIQAARVALGQVSDLAQACRAFMDVLDVARAEGCTWSEEEEAAHALGRVALGAFGEMSPTEQAFHDLLHMAKQGFIEGLQDGGDNRTGRVFKTCALDDIAQAAYAVGRAALAE